MQPKLERRFENVVGVLQPVDVTFLVTVMGRDLKLCHSGAGVEGLEQDFGVEMKIVCVDLEGNSPQERRRIAAQSGVVFREALSRYKVLEPRQDPVSNDLVGWHPAAP